MKCFCLICLIQFHTESRTRLYNLRSAEGSGRWLMKWLEPFFSYGRPSSQPHCCWQWVRFIYNMTLFTWTFWLDLVLLSCWTHQMSLFFPPITNPLFSSKYYLCLCYCASSSHHHTVSNVDDPARMNFVFPLDCKSWNSRVSVHRTVAKVCLDNSLYLQRRSVRWKIPADENIYIYILENSH